MFESTGQILMITGLGGRDGVDNTQIKFCNLSKEQLLAKKISIQHNQILLRPTTFIKYVFVCCKCSKKHVNIRLK
jgi:hypothetical protein